MRNLFRQNQQTVSPTFYLSLLEFLLQAKHSIVAIGDELGLTSLQAITLLLVDERRPRPMKNFCMLYHCDASNITGIVDGLEQKGMVSRRSDPKDRRIKTIRLEPAGRQMQQCIIEKLETSNGLLLDSLSASEAKQLVQIIDKLAATKKPV